MTTQEILIQYQPKTRLKDYRQWYDYHGSQTSLRALKKELFYLKEFSSYADYRLIERKTTIEEKVLE